MKLVIAMMQHETNTFSPLPTSYEAFGRAIGFDEPPCGQEAVDTFRGTGTALGGFLDLAAEADAAVEVPIVAYAEPSGHVLDEAFERLTARICEAVARGCDAVLLDLHGAMVTESLDDGEGELLARLRSVDKQVPIGVALDFHSNVSAAMVENATVITGYRTYPHIDMYETGLRCGRTVLAALGGKIVPRLTWGALPLMSAMLCQTPSREPMKTPMDKAIAAEASGRVLNASVFGGFPLADVPHVALSSLVVSDGDPAAGRALCCEILEAAWQAREGFVFRPEPLSETIAKAKALRDGPIVIADYGDNSGAGGPMDDVSVLAEIQRQGLSDVAAGPIWDPEALAVMREAGLGTQVTLSVGGKTNSPTIDFLGEPLELSGRVVSLTDGRFAISGEMMTGFPVNLEGTAVLDTGSIQVVVSGARCEPYDPQFFEHVGIDPARKRYLVIKSRQHFRAGFEPIAKHILLAAGRGVCREDFESMPYRRLKRPIYPLDRDWHGFTPGSDAS